MADGKDLLAFLRKSKLDEYGSVIYGEDVRLVVGIELPTVGTRQDFANAAMAELQAVDYCRNVLLGEGKYLSSEKGDYRILLPSENARQIELYISSADRKLRRAGKLSRNSPHANHGTSNNSARIEMKRASIKSKLETANLVK